MIDVASKVGLSARTFFAAIALHEGLSPEVRLQLAGTALADNQAELVRLSKLSSERQEAVLGLMLGDEPKARKVEEAVHLLDHWVDPTDPVERAFNKLVRAWHQAPKKARVQFLEYVASSKGRP